MANTKSNKENFKRFYATLPIYGPTKVSNPAYKKFYSKVYKGNTHNLPLLHRTILAIIHKPLWLYKGTKSIFSELKENSTEVSEQEGISKGDQFKALFHLAFVKKVPPAYYYTLKSYKDKKIQLGEKFIINQHAGSIHSRLVARTKNRDKLNNKFQFYTHCLESKQNLIPVIALSRNGKISLTIDYKKIPDTSLFIKPTDGNYGRGCHAIHYKNEKFTFRKKAFTKKQFVGFLSKIGTREPYILQPLLSNIDAIQDLSGGGGLLTTRIITYIDRDEKIKIFFSFLQMPVEDEVISNRGLYAKIDIASGKLGNAYDSKKYNVPYTKHPTTGATIAGRIIPNWDHAKEICIDLHKHFLDIPMIGWDVAYTIDGIKIIEGNLNWSIEISERLEKDFDIEHYVNLMNYHIDKYEQNR